MALSWGFQDSVESDEELTLDGLGFDCLVCICEWLTPEDLCRFSGVCKVDLVLTDLRSHTLSKVFFLHVL